MVFRAPLVLGWATVDQVAALFYHGPLVASRHPTGNAKFRKASAGRDSIGGRKVVGKAFLASAYYGGVTCIVRERMMFTAVLLRSKRRSQTRDPRKVTAL